MVRKTMASGISLDETTVGRELKGLGFSKISARPRHYAQMKGRGQLAAGGDLAFIASLLLSPRSRLFGFLGLIFSHRASWPDAARRLTLSWNRGRGGRFLRTSDPPAAQWRTNASITSRVRSANW